MKRLFFVISVSFLLLGCKGDYPPAPLGLDWNMSESEIKSMINPSSRIIANQSEHFYAITPPKEDIKDGEYATRFEDGKIVTINAFFLDLKHSDAEKISAYYNSILYSEYGEPINIEPDNQSQLNCINYNNCQISGLKYSKGGVSVTVRTNKGVLDSQVIVGYMIDR